MAPMTMQANWRPYCGEAPLPAEILGRWNLDPALMLILAAGLFLMLRWSDGMPGRRLPICIGFALMVLLFISPLCALSAALFSARVIHHVALTGLIAPLLIAGLPAAGPRLPGSLPLWTVAHALVFWLWHAPPAYGWALSNHSAYWLMQLSLLGSALGLWAAIRRAPAPSAVAALLATMVQMGLLGALLTFTLAPIYAPHWLSTVAWGLSPLEDQQLAGLIMWVPGALIYLGAAFLIMWRWMGDEQRQVPE